MYEPCFLPKIVYTFINKGFNMKIKSYKIEQKRKNQKAQYKREAKQAKSFIKYLEKDYSNDSDF